MMYRGDGTAAFVGLERIAGRLGGRSGSVVLQRTGLFEDGQAKESYLVIPGSATGELQGLEGEGTSSVGHGLEDPFTLNDELAPAMRARRVGGDGKAGWVSIATIQTSGDEQYVGGQAADFCSATTRRDAGDLSAALQARPEAAR